MTAATRTSTAPATGAPALSLPGILHAEALREPARVVLTALDRDGEPAATLTAGEYDTAARALAGRLLAAAAPGDRVLLPAMPGLRFQVAFMACVYAGMVAVPLPPAAAVRRRDDRRGNRFDRLVAICRDVEPALAVVPGDRVERMVEVWAGDAALSRVRVVGTEASCETGSAVEPVTSPPAVDPGALAFLQYTSGSTAAPRGVMITHGAMLANQEMVRTHLGITTTATIVTWLPVYHDMGLCLGLLLPLYCRSQAVVLDPDTFVMSPEVWLRAISGRPDVFSAAPDSAYAWCVRRLGAGAGGTLTGLDLSGWRVSVNGAEPVRAETVRAFHAAFAGCGLGERTLTPAYGLAESTLFVAGGSGAVAPVSRRYDRAELGRGRAVPVAGDPGPAGAVEVVSCGWPAPGAEVLVVDPDTRHPLPARAVGEIWLRSPSNGAGYWRRPEESREVFAAVPATGAGGEGWLRTGDLGFLDDGELYVTGRRKDVLIVHGVNYYPQDFEWLAREAHPLLAGELAIACAAGDADDRVTVVVESADRSDLAGAAEAASAAVRAVTAELPVITDVVVVSRGQLPRTTSGKARRQECARRLREDGFTVLARWPRRTD